MENQRAGTVTIELLSGEEEKIEQRIQDIINKIGDFLVRSFIITMVFWTIVCMGTSIALGLGRNTTLVMAIFLAYALSLLLLLWIVHNFYPFVRKKRAAALEQLRQLILNPIGQSALAKLKVAGEVNKKFGVFDYTSTYHRLKFSPVIPREIRELVH